MLDMYTYAMTQWNDENVNNLCANKISLQEFFEKCRPDMSEEARQELFYHYFHDYFHDHKYRIDPQWLLTQMQRSDSEERLMAFYDSIYDAIVTDREDWVTKGADVMIALMQNNATALLIALCGWGAASLAKRARMMHGVCDYDDENVHGVLKVDWSDDLRTSVPCLICPEDHRIDDFDYSVFTREDNPTATIQNVFVRFKPFGSGNEYDFHCVSQAERNATNDNDIFWYLPVDDAE
jgi:hypothetical protein